MIENFTVMKNYIKYLCAALLVIGASASTWGVVYEKVTDLSTLNTNDIVIITNSGGTEALSKTVSGSKYASESVSIGTNGKISTTSSNIMQLTVKVNGGSAPHLYAFWTGSGWLYDDGTNNHLKVNSGSWNDGISSGANWVWGITLYGSTKNYQADIANDKYKSGTDCPRFLQYNSGFCSSKAGTAGSPRNAIIWRISCTEPTVAFASPTSYTLSYGDSWTDGAKTATVKYNGSNTGQTITYSSNNTSVASVNKNSGAITLGGSTGTATITATAAETDTYCEATGTYTITVNPVCPSLIKDALAAGSITSTSATLSGGKITSKGGANITEYGFVYGTSANPTISNNIANWTGDKAVNEAFSSKEITGLTPNTTYHVRVYAKNSAGTCYSESEITFTTLQQYTITYNKNDGSGTTTTKNVDAGGSIIVGDGVSFSRTGYTLTNWRLNNATTGTVYNNGSSYSSIGANATFYAQWAPISYSVRFNANGGSGSMSNQNFTYDVAQNLTTNTFTRTGYDFAGWATSTNGAVAYTNGQSVSKLSSTNDEVVDLYAKWTAHEINLTLNANGGDEDGSAKVLYDATALKDGTLNHATYEGHSLEGYYAEAEHTTKVLNNDGTFAAATVSDYITNSKWTRDEATTLYAYWASNPQTVTFDLGGHGDNFTRIVGYGETVTQPANPTHVDYNFVKWVTTEGGNTEFDFSTAITSNITIYAQWTAKSYQHLIFACVDINLVTEDGDPIYVTSRNGINVMATKKLKVSVSGALPGHRITLTGTDLKFYVDDGTRYIELTGNNSLVAPLNEQIVYVSYSPSSAGTNGAPTAPSITVACDGDSQEFTNKIKARNLPDAVTIVARVGNSWHALPANISTGNPAPVMVNIETIDGVLKAKGPSNLSYKLWSAAVVASNNSRWGDVSTAYTPSAKNGDRLRFSGVGYHPLWANNSSTANTISNKSDATLNDAGHYFTNDEGYEWKVTTTEDANGEFVYTLQTDQSQNSNYLRLWGSKWGTYDDSHGVADVYILPLVPTEPADITIMEWGTTEIAVKYANASNVSSGTFKAKIGASDQTDVTCTSLGGDIYKLTGVGDLQANPAKSLVLSMTESSTAKQAVFAIPLIVTESKTEAQLCSYAAGGDGSTLITEGRAIAKGLDVIIRSGGTLTTGTAQGKFANLYIYPGGKADISNNIALSNIYMRGGFSWLDASKDYRLPQMKVADEVSIDGVQSTGNGIFYDLYLDNTMYYMTAFPRDVALNSVTNEEGTDDWTGWVKGYSGKGRTKTPKDPSWIYAWEMSPGTTLYRGQGYEIAIKPRSTGAMNGRTIGILRFPLLYETEWSGESSPEIYVTAWGVDDQDVSANNQGWNYIGNPYFTGFQNTDAAGQFGTVMEIRKLTEEIKDGKWTGKYVWVTDSKVKYITVPDKMVENYTDVKTKNYEIDAFFPFFIQAASSGYLTFTGNKILKARALNPVAVPAREVEIDFTLSDPNGKSDNAGLVVGNEYSAEFDMDDKEKTIVNENFLKVYTMVGEYRTAFNSLPETEAAQPIPVGYIAPVDGKYTFALDDEDYSEVDHIWLTDYEKGVTIDLLDATDFAYEFETVKSTNNTRLALNIVLKPEDIDPIETGVESVYSYGDEPMKFIHQDKMYILYHGIIYDATGKKVREINK